uniref:Uncharacterized protein n=1 Tax=Opuntia streptacantha TaxID=393608 RepID=A0A7C9AAG9_OPUST
MSIKYPKESLFRVAFNLKRSRESIFQSSPPASLTVNRVEPISLLFHRRILRRSRCRRGISESRLHNRNIKPSRPLPLQQSRRRRRPRGRWAVTGDALPERAGGERRERARREIGGEKVRDGLVM